MSVSILDSYLDELPKNIDSAVARSFFGGFALSYFFESEKTDRVAMGFFRGAIGAGAAAVSALARPFVKKAFPEVSLIKSITNGLILASAHEVFCSYFGVKRYIAKGFFDNIAAFCVFSIVWSDYTPKDAWTCLSW